MIVIKCINGWKCEYRGYITITILEHHVHIHAITSIGNLNKEDEDDPTKYLWDSNVNDMFFLDDIEFIRGEHDKEAECREKP